MLTAIQATAKQPYPLSGARRFRVRACSSRARCGRVCGRRRSAGRRRAVGQHLDGAPGLSAARGSRHSRSPAEIGILCRRQRHPDARNADAVKSRDTGLPKSLSRQGILALLEYAARPEIAPLGCAIPSADLLAAGGLDRFLARAARLKGTSYNVYTEPRGDAQLRHEICRRALRFGQAVSPEAIAITNGCTEALSLALRAVTRRGDTVAIEFPTYFGLLQVLEALELKALEIPTDADTGLDIDALAKALASEPIHACLFSSAFNNPLGCCMSDDRKRAILAVLEHHGVPLIEDDIYGDIYFGRARPKPFAALAPEADVLYCSSYSKTLAPGYRVGWIATPRHIGRVLEGKFALNLCGAALPQVALAEFLISGGYDRHLRRMRRLFAENVDRISRSVDRNFPAETRLTRPAGGYVLWLQMPAGFDSQLLFDRAIKRGICFAPGTIFSPSKSHANCLRLSCGRPWDERLEDSIRTLGELTTQMLGER